jgi:hypothetical protein
LQTNILKEDSLLQRYIAETWAAQSSLEDAMSDFKVEVMKTDNEVLIKKAEKVD